MALKLSDLKPGDYEVQGAQSASQPQKLSDLKPGDYEVKGSHGKAETALESFGKGLTFGYLPQIQAGVEKATDFLTGSPSEPYVQIRDANVRRQKAQAEENPGTALGSEVAGGIVSGIAAPGAIFGKAGQAAKAAEAVKAAEELKNASTLAKLANTGVRVVKGAAEGAKIGGIYGAIQNPGDVEGEVSPLQLDQRLENAKTGAKFGGLVGGAAPLIVDTVKGAVKVAPGVAKAAAKKVGKVLADVPEETTQRYLENPDQINNAPTREKIATDVLDLKNKAEDNLAKAQEDLSNAKTKLTETKADTRAGVQDEKFAASGDQSEAQRAFDEKKQQFKEALKSNKLTSMAGDVVGAIGELKQQVVKGSDEAYDILGQSNGTVKTKPLLKLLQGHVDSMMVNGVPASKSAEQAVAEIQSMQSRLTKMGDEISMPQAKQILQGLDKDIDYSKSAGSFAPQTDQAFSQLRKNLDATVKTAVKPYADKMKEVAAKTNLLSQANELYGDPKRAISNLNGVASEKGQALHLPILQSLSEHTGKDLISPAQDFITNQKILSTPSLFEKAIENIPEAKALRAAKTKAAQLADPAFTRGAMESSSAPIEKEIEGLSAKADAAKEKSQLFSGVTPDSVTAKTKALNGANSIGAEAKFGDIDKAHGTNFKQQIQARNDLDQFKKTDTAGSRKTLLGTIVGGGLGLLVGHPMVGAELGAAGGAAADKYGGQMFKYALDKGMQLSEKGKSIADALRKVPGLSQLEIDNPKAFQNAINILADEKIDSSAAKAAGKEPAPQKGRSKWVADGFDKIMQHADPKMQAALKSVKSDLMNSPKASELLVAASDLKPGSKAMDRVLDSLTKLKRGQ